MFHVEQLLRWLKLHFFRYGQMVILRHFTNGGKVKQPVPRYNMGPSTYTRARLYLHTGMVCRKHSHCSRATASTEGRRQQDKATKNVSVVEPYGFSDDVPRLTRI
jgi:hypothetical protein